MTTYSRLCMALAAAALASACDAREGDLAEPTTVETRTAAPAASDDPGAAAQFATAEGISLMGAAELYEVPGGVRIDVVINDAKPGTHAIHIHETDDCSDIPGKSMGDHFNPHNVKHGLPTEATRHLGDLGNIVIRDDGTATMDVVTAGGSLREGDPETLIGRAIVIHENPDVGAQPAGDAGKPIACAPIKST